MNEHDSSGSSSSINRRKFLRNTILGLAALACGVGIPSTMLDVKDSPRAEYDGMVGRDEHGLYAEFRGNKFRILELRVQKDESLDDVLYRLNNEHNPNLKINDDKLERLNGLFETLNKAPSIGSLEKGMEAIFRYRYSQSPTRLIAGKWYYFPFYSQK